MLKSALIFATLAAICSAQAPPATADVLRANTRLVVLDVVVANDKGLVRGLAKEDFILEDKGKKQNIAVFEISEADKAPVTPLPRGVASNRYSSKGLMPATASVILYDRINFASTGDQAFVRNQVLSLLSELKETDHVGFYALGFTLQMIRNYDEDAAPLARVAKALQKSGDAPADFSPEDKQLFKALSDALSPMQALQPQARVNITHPAFRSIGRHLGGVPGRKNLIWIASSFPLTFANSVERRKNDQEEVDAFRNNLTENNIALYPIDPGGTGASFNQYDGAPIANEGSLMPGALRNSTNTSAMTNVGNSLTGNQAMQLFAEASGGRAYRNANDIVPALREILSLAAYTYTLGFYAEEKNLDGKIHDLKVSLVKKPATDKARTNHRKQYLAWGPKSPNPPVRPTMAQIMEDSVLAGQIGLMAVANPDPAKPGSQVVDVRVSTADIRFTPKGDQFAAAFDIAFATEGKAPSLIMTYTPTVTAETMRQILVNGMDIRETVAATGTLRIGILDRGSGSAGSVRVPLQ